MEYACLSKCVWLLFFFVTFECKLRYFADVQAVLFYTNMTADLDCPAPNQDKKYNKNGPDDIWHHWFFLFSFKLQLGQLMYDFRRFLRIQWPLLCLFVIFLEHNNPGAYSFWFKKSILDIHQNIFPSFMDKRKSKRFEGNNVRVSKWRRKLNFVLNYSMPLSIQLYMVICLFNRCIIWVCVHVRVVYVCVCLL